MRRGAKLSLYYSTIILVDASATWQTGYRDSLARVGKADKGNEIANRSPRVSHIE